jgi:hypothetical protein
MSLEIIAGDDKAIILDDTSGLPLMMTAFESRGEAEEFLDWTTSDPDWIAQFTPAEDIRALTPQQFAELKTQWEDSKEEYLKKKYESGVTAS